MVMAPNWGMLHPLARHLPEEMPPSYGRVPEVEAPRGPFVMDGVGGSQKRDARIEMDSQRTVQSSSSWDKGGMGELASTAGILPTAQYLGHKAEIPTSGKALDASRGHSSHMEANNLNIVAEINRLKDQEEELRRGGAMSKYFTNSKDAVQANPEMRDPNNSAGSEAGHMPPSMGSSSGASINDEATHNAILRKMKQETADGEDWISCSLCPFSANNDAVFKRHIVQKVRAMSEFKVITDDTKINDEYIIVNVLKDFIDVVQKVWP